jgi:hypothetical protein
MGNDEGIPSDPGFWWKLVHLNPTLWRALIVATIALLGAVGIAVNGSIEDSLFLFITAVAAIVQGVWTRGSVTANQKVVVYKPDPVGEPHTLSAGPSVSYDEDAVVAASQATVDPASM